VPISAISAGLSGIASAEKRIGVASHNVANLLTEEFRPLEAEQHSRAGGGSYATVEQEAEPREVDLAREFVGMDVAALQAKASMRVIETELDVLGSLLDIKA
jgi:flagellar hook protein FlgE